MISSTDFASRVETAEKSGSIVELSDGMIDLVVGGGPEDFFDVFHDSHVEGGVGPTFTDSFLDRYPYEPKQFDGGF